MKHGPHSLVWVALADFFAALALVALALYGHQRQENIRVSRDVKDLARSIHRRLQQAGVDNKFDESSASIILLETVVFSSGQFLIDAQHRGRVRTIGSVLKAEAKSWPGRFVIVIRGHTDAWPPKAAARLYKDNFDLSWLRAREVEREFLAEGIRPPGFQVAVQGVGQEEPAVDNCRGESATPRPRCSSEDQIRLPEELGRNRRIELKFGHFSGNTDTAGEGGKPPR